MDQLPSPTIPDPLPPPQEKPIDRWLSIGGIVLGLVFFLIPKTLALVVLCSLGIFALMVHPLVNFWWIEKTKMRKICAVLAWAAVCVAIGWGAWPTPPTPQLTAKEIVDEIDRRKNSAKSSSDSTEGAKSPNLAPDKSIASKKPAAAREVATKTLPAGLVNGRLAMAVTPAAVKLLTLDDQLVAFSLTNSTTQDIYSVAVLLTVEGSSELTWEDFKLILPSSSRKPLFDQPLDNGYMPHDIMGAIGKDDQQRVVVLINIFRLIPNEKRDFEVLSKKKGPSRIVATATGSLEQMPRISREKFKALPFFTPIKISLNQVIN